MPVVSTMCKRKLAEESLDECKHVRINARGNGLIHETGRVLHAIHMPVVSATSYRGEPLKTKNESWNVLVNCFESRE